MGMPQRLPVPNCRPLLSSCNLFARPLWPFSPSPSPPFYVAAPVPPLASATRAHPSSTPSAVVYQFSPSVRVSCHVRGLLLLKRRLTTPPLNILFRVTFPDVCLRQVDHITCIVGTIR